VYKAVLVHEIVPGKYSDIERWFENADRERKQRDPDYVPPKRYITVIGNLTRFFAEFELDAVPAKPSVWSESIERHGDLKDIVVPGRTELYVLKKMRIES
jgi:hypothetical protein